MSNLSFKPIVNGKTVFFNSPFTRNNELVRTGINTENSFYHALLQAYTEDYSESSDDERNEMVSKFISSLNKKVTNENWEELNSKHKVVTISSVLIKAVESFYDYLETKQNSSEIIKTLIRELRIDTNFELFEAIFELLSFSYFKNTLKSTTNDLNNNSIREYKPIFTRHIVTSLNNSQEFRSLQQEKKKYIINIINNFLHIFFRELESYCFQTVKNTITTVQDKVNSFILNAVSSRFKRDLFIIDSSNKLPIDNTEVVQGRKSIVLLQFDNHFELIGRVMQKNNIQYEFDTNDEYIKLLSMFLHNPERLKKKHPDLASAIFSGKNKRNLYDSESDSEPEPEEERKPKQVWNNSDNEEEENNQKEEESIHRKVINEAETLLQNHSMFQIKPPKKRDTDNGSRNREERVSSRVDRKSDRDRDRKSDRDRDRKSDRDRDERKEKREIPKKREPEPKKESINPFLYNSESDSD